MEYNRQTDLSEQLNDNDLKALAKAFKAAGWECGTAEILQVARSNASSNHWKDIIYEYLASKETEAPPEESAPANEEAEAPQPKPAKRRSRSKKSSD